MATAPLRVATRLEPLSRQTDRRPENYCYANELKVRERETPSVPLILASTE